MTPTDTEMLDWLEVQNEKARHTGRCCFRWSVTGRGWRLHEDYGEHTHETVRQALTHAMSEDKGRTAR